MLLQQIFDNLFFAQTEADVSVFIAKNPHIFDQSNWFPYGADENYFGVIESQQASPIPALVEKITNSIDAVLMRKCLLSGIDPKGIDAPKSMEEAIDKFYPNHNWDIRQNQRHQAENIQIIADGPKEETSLIIYDDGEGQHPKDFERTFLSLLKGNKTEIHFVQGKFNMGGSGALVFCGKNRYQLIGSKKFDNSGEFGFTLVRRHIRNAQEKQTKRHTWYEFLKIDGQIPAFPITELNLNLYQRKFTTGTVIKLFAFQMKGITDISRDLNLSLNEFLFEPALPIFTIEKEARYPKTPQMQREMFGLKRRLDKQGDTYLDKEWNFSEVYHEPKIGSVKVTVYVFKSRIEDKNVKDSRLAIRREFFKNGMSVMYGLNGQIQGFDSASFISSSKGLDFQLLRDHLLIHVDCTNMHPEFRDELFMASRDRLKDGDDAKYLKALLIKNLTKSKLHDLYKFRKSNLSIEGTDTGELMKNMAKSLGINKDLLTLIQQTFKLEEGKKEKPKDQHPQKDYPKKDREETIFHPKRFPSIFNLKGAKDGIPMIQIPLGDNKVLKFETDVENQYFDRVEEPGELKIAVLNYRQNTRDGGTERGLPSAPADFISVNSTSPDKGTIKVILQPSETVGVGDAFEVKATLTSPGNDLEQYFMVKISNPEGNKVPKPKEVEAPEPSGLPDYYLVYKEAKEGFQSYDDLEASSIEMGFSTIMHPLIESDKLAGIYINMDSQVLTKFKSKLKKEEQLQFADRKYISSVYFHTIMLFAITKQKKYNFNRIDASGQVEEVELSDYLKDVFESHYSNFLLNYGSEELMQSLD